MRPRLEYTQEELLATHDIAESLYAAGVRCHGGFLADGTYVSPRTKYRMPAPINGFAEKVVEYSPWTTESLLQ